MENMMSDEKVAKRLLSAWKMAKPGETIPYEMAYVVLAEECPITPEEIKTAKSLEATAEEILNR
jgi:hypothetical protein